MDTCVLGQPFGGNYNPFYKQSGLLGHPGDDEACGYDTPIYSKYDGIVSMVVRPENAGPEGYTLVAIIVDDGYECFEWIVGHCDPAVNLGDVVHEGMVIGYEANHGKVYSGNIEITPAMQKAGDQRGHHRHYQKRPIMPVPATDWRYEFLSGQPTNPYRNPISRQYYRIFEPWNGYNGCISPLRPVFYRTLTVGMSGYDVFVMQRILSRKGFLTAEPTGFFGTATLAALRQFQSSVMGVAPVFAAGPLTRTYLNREVGPLVDLSTQ